MAEQQQSFTPGEVPMTRKSSFTVPGDIFYELTVVVGNHVYIGQGDRAVITISRSAGEALAHGLIEHLVPSVGALTNGQQYEQDYTPGADTPPPAAAGDRSLAEAAARIIDPDAWHETLPTDGCGAYWIGRRNEARTKADAILALRTPEPNSGGEADHG